MQLVVEARTTTSVGDAAPSWSGAEAPLTPQIDPQERFLQLVQLLDHKGPAGSKKRAVNETAVAGSQRGHTVRLWRLLRCRSCSAETNRLDAKEKKRGYLAAILSCGYSLKHTSTLEMLRSSHRRCCRLRCSTAHCLLLRPLRCFAAGQKVRRFLSGINGKFCSQKNSRTTAFPEYEMPATPSAEGSRVLRA